MNLKEEIAELVPPIIRENWRNCVDLAVFTSWILLLSAGLPGYTDWNAEVQKAVKNGDPKARLQLFGYSVPGPIELHDNSKLDTFELWLAFTAGVIGYGARNAANRTKHAFTGQND